MHESIVLQCINSHERLNIDIQDLLKIYSVNVDPLMTFFLGSKFFSANSWQITLSKGLYGITLKGFRQTI